MFLQDGQALDMSGSTDWASFTFTENNCLLEPGMPGCEKMSLAVWIKILGLPHGGATRGGVITTRANSIKWGTQIYTTLHGLANYVFTAPGNKEYEIFGYYPTPGWFHVILTLDIVSGQMYQYVNGLYEDSDTSPYQSGITYTTGTNVVVFGRESTTADQYYGNVQIDDLLVFNYVLDSNQVITLYNSY